MIHRKLVLIVSLVCGLLFGCNSGPGVTVPVGFDPAVSYPNTFLVEASQTGPPATQAHETQQNRRIWRAEFRGIRRIPLETPALAEIETLCVPAFSEALAGYAF